MLEPATLCELHLRLSSHSRRAGEVAARLAARTHAALEFFCAVPANVVDDHRVDLDRARTAVEALAHRCAEATDREARARIAVVRDVPAAILSELRRSRASLLVVAPHGSTGWKRALLGSVTEKLLSRASTSVLVARRSIGGPWRRILVGVDRRPNAATTLRHAIALARAVGADLDVVHVVRPAELLFPLVAPASRAALAGDRRLAAKAREFRRWAARFPARGVRVRVGVVEGSPAERLVGEAGRRSADLVVVGAADDARLRRAMLGSVSRAVASVSPVSVLVVREPRRER